MSQDGKAVLPTDHEGMRRALQRIRVRSRPTPFFFSWCSPALEGRPAIVLGAPHQKRPSREAISAHMYPGAVYGRAYYKKGDYVFELFQEADKPRLTHKFYETAAQYGASIPRRRILLLCPSDLRSTDPISRAREQRAENQKKRRQRLERYLEMKTEE